MDATIRVEDVVKLYASGFRAIDGMSFAVEAGEIFGFLGPNGAGKSTMVRMLTTLSLPSSGHIHVGGYDVTHNPGMVRQVAGVALQEIGIDPLMTATELLVLQCRLFGLPQPQARRRTNELLELVKLTESTARPVGQYSGGMRRRLDLALALAHEPAILFLDEPTTGLDPASRRDIWTEVQRLNRERGMTIFLTTQYLEEADVLANRVAIINRGQIVAEGRPDTLKAALGHESIVLTFADDAAARQAKQRLAPLVPQTQLDHHMLWLYLPDAAQAIVRVVGELGEIGVQPKAVTLAQPTLDDVFLQVTGQQFAAENTNQRVTAAV